MCNIRIKHKYKIPFNRIDFATVLFFIKMVVTVVAWHCAKSKAQIQEQIGIVLNRC
jgi:hypothetical protein